VISLFDYSIDPKLIIILQKLHKKDKDKYFQVKNKIKEIILNDLNTIDNYKNLKQPLSKYKRVHIGKNFVLLFSVFKSKNYIFFYKFDHRDNIYK